MLWLIFPLELLISDNTVTDVAGWQDILREGAYPVGSLDTYGWTSQYQDADQGKHITPCRMYDTVGYCYNTVQDIMKLYKIFRSLNCTQHNSDKVEAWLDFELTKDTP